MGSPVGGRAVAKSAAGRRRRRHPAAVRARRSEVDGERLGPPPLVGHHDMQGRAAIASGWHSGKDQSPGGRAARRATPRIRSAGDNDATGGQWVEQRSAAGRRAAARADLPARPAPAGRCCASCGTAASSSSCSPSASCGPATSRPGSGFAWALVTPFLLMVVFTAVLQAGRRRPDRGRALPAVLLHRAAAVDVLLRRHRQGRGEHRPEPHPAQQGLLPTRGVPAGVGHDRRGRHRRSPCRSSASCSSIYRFMPPARVGLGAGADGSCSWRSRSASR